MTMDLVRPPGRLKPVGCRATLRRGYRGHRGTSRGLGREITKPPGEGSGLCLGVWVEPPVGIEPTTFSLRGGSSSSHRLTTSDSGNTAARSVREIPHEHPVFRAMDDATADDHRRQLRISG